MESELFRINVCPGVASVLYAHEPTDINFSADMRNTLHLHPFPPPMSYRKAHGRRLRGNWVNGPKTLRWERAYDFVPLIFREVLVNTSRSNVIGSESK